MYKLHKMRTKKDFDKQNEYNRKKYDHINLMIPKGMKEEWQNMAIDKGQSLNAFIIECVKIAQSAEEVCKNEKNK